MSASCRRVLEEAKVDASAIKLVIPHQANLRIIQSLAQRLDVPEDRVFININRFGNTSAASIGLCLDEAARAGRIQPGDYVLLTAFGGGLTWGAMLIQY